MPDAPDTFGALLAQASKAHPHPGQKGETTNFGDLIAKLEAHLEKVSAEKGPASDEANQIRREINHVRYTK